MSEQMRSMLAVLLLACCAGHLGWTLHRFLYGEYAITLAIDIDCNEPKPATAVAPRRGEWL